MKDDNYASVRLIIWRLRAVIAVLFSIVFNNIQHLYFVLNTTAA